MNPWETALLVFGGNAALLLVLGVLARSLLSQYLAKDLKQHETELTQRTILATEELKHRLAVSAHEHQVRFSKLHERQAQVFEDLYVRVIEFEDASISMSLTSNTTPENLLEFALRRAEDSLKELAQYVRRHEIFLPEDTSRRLHSLLDQVRDKKLSGNGIGDYFPEHKEAWSVVHKYLEHEAPAVRKSLESEFRKRLGAEPT
jgi:hypothetical protein